MIVKNTKPNKMLLLMREHFSVEEMIFKLLIIGTRANRYANYYLYNLNFIFNNYSCQ